MKEKDINEIDLTPAEVSRFARHLSLPEIGINGQKKLKAASVLCIGSGGLGSPVLLYLASAGVGRIGIVDFDKVEESNLQRQVIHGTSWLGKPKTSSAKARILELNPSCKVDIFQTMLTRDNALEIIDPYDIICDCTDNFQSRYLLNDACFLLKKPNVYGAIHRFEGQVTVFNLDSCSPNYRDLLPEPPPSELIPSCEEGGVMGVLPGLIGLIQTTEIIKLITGAGKSLSGRLLIVDALTMKFKELRLTKDPNRKAIDRLIDYDKFCKSKAGILDNNDTCPFKSIHVKKMKELLENYPDDIVLLDVRTPEESKIFSITGSKLIPLKDIQNGKALNQIKGLAKDRQLYVHCKSNNRSIKALLELQRHNISGINVTGGIDAWLKEVASEECDS